MKKLFSKCLAIFLSVLMLIASISTAIAITPTGLNGGELHWIGYYDSMAYYGDPLQVNQNFKFEDDTTNVYTGEGADNDGKALKVTPVQNQLFGAVLSFEANSYYQLSFMCKSSSLQANWNAVFSNAGVVNSGTNWKTAGDYLGNVERDKAYYNNQYGKKVDVSTELLADKKTNTWYKTTISFYTADKTTAYITMRPLVSTPIYLDAFDLVKLDQPLAGADEFINSWTAYSGVDVGGNAASWVNVTQNSTAKADDVDGDGKTIQVNNGFAQSVTANISVKKDTNYKWSFYYYSPALNASSNDIRTCFSHFGVVKTDKTWITTVNANGSSYVAKTKTITSDTSTATNVKTNEWVKVDLYFYSANETNLLVACRPTNDGSADVYFDALSLEEVDHLPGENVGDLYGWAMFDNGTTTIGSTATYRDRRYYTIVDTDLTGTDFDNDGKALEITGGYAQWLSAKVAVEKNTCYKLSGAYKSTSVTADDGVFSDIAIFKNGAHKNDQRLSSIVDTAGKAFYVNAADDKIPVRDVKTSGVNKDAWNEFEIYFYSGNNDYVWASFRPNGTKPNDTPIVHLDALEVSKISELPTPNPWATYTDDQNTDHLIGVGGTTIANAVTETNSKVYTGEDGDGDGKSFEVSKAAYCKYVGYDLAFKPNTYYEFSAYYYADVAGGSNSDFSHMKIAKYGAKYMTDDATTSLAVKHRSADAYYWDENGAKITLTGVNCNNAVASQWCKINITFYSGSETRGVFVFRSVLDKNSIYIDNIKLTEIVPASDAVMSDACNSMRTEGTQALRYKFDVAKSALKESAFGSYTITEYGYIAIRDKYLSAGEELTLDNEDAVYQSAYKAGEKDVIFAENETVKTVSVALLNIGLNKETGVVDYDAYGSGYTVRPYYVLTGANGETIYAYGDSYSASIFATMQFILNEANTEVSENDRNAINDILDTVADDADKDTNKTVRDYYNAWVSAQ